MKTLFFSLFFALGLSAQSNVTVTFPSVDTAQESPIPVTYQAVTFPNIIAFIKTWSPNNNWPNSPTFTPQNTTLGAAITSTSATTATLTSAANLAFGNGLTIDSETVAVTGFPNVTGPTYSSGASTCVNGTQTVLFTHG